MECSYTPAATKTTTVIGDHWLHPQSAWLRPSCVPGTVRYSECWYESNCSKSGATVQGRRWTPASWSILGDCLPEPAELPRQTLVNPTNGGRSLVSFSSHHNQNIIHPSIHTSLSLLQYSTKRLFQYETCFFSHLVVVASNDICLYDWSLGLFLSATIRDGRIYRILQQQYL